MAAITVATAAATGVAMATATVAKDLHQWILKKLTRFKKRVAKA